MRESFAHQILIDRSASDQNRCLGFRNVSAVQWKVWESRGCTRGHRFPHPHPPPSPHSLKKNIYPSPLNLTLTLLDKGGCPEHDGQRRRQAERSRARDANAYLFGSEISTGPNLWTGQATERRRRLPGGVRRGSGEARRESFTHQNLIGRPTRTSKQEIRMFAAITVWGVALRCELSGIQGVHRRTSVPPPPSTAQPTLFERE